VIVIEITCPHCGTTGDIRLFLAHEEGREVLRQLLRLPPSYFRDVWQYVCLFKPVKNHISMKKAARLIAEVADFL
jgi:hypothetical protein